MPESAPQPEIVSPKMAKEILGERQVLGLNLDAEKALGIPPSEIPPIPFPVEFITAVRARFPETRLVLVSDRVKIDESDESVPATASNLRKRKGYGISSEVFSGYRDMSETLGNHDQFIYPKPRARWFLVTGFLFPSKDIKRENRNAFTSTDAVAQILEQLLSDGVCGDRAQMYERALKEYKEWRQVRERNKGTITDEVIADLLITKLTTMTLPEVMQTHLYYRNSGQKLFPAPDDSDRVGFRTSYNTDNLWDTGVRINKQRTMSFSMPNTREGECWLLAF